jgi:mRNA-degrading endonuclease HigB of HigAB toxin-antitoxin module
MMSKKNYIKEKNILDIRGTSYGVIVIKTCIFIITLLAFTSIAFALSWEGKGFAVDGCTDSPIEEWKSEKLSFHNEKTINIKGSKIVIIGSHNSDEYFLRNKHSFEVGGKSIEFTVNISDREKEIYIKTQPHLITTKKDYGKSNHDFHNC